MATGSRAAARGPARVLEGRPARVLEGRPARVLARVRVPSAVPGPRRITPCSVAPVHSA